MSEQPTVEQSSPLKSVDAQPTPPPDPKIIEWNKRIHSAIAVCSVALIGCFFLPWLNIVLGQTATGYDLQRLPGDEAKYLLIIPILGLVSLLAVISKQSIATASQLAGALPFLALLYFCIKIGHELLNDLCIGAYLTLLIGAVLFVLPRFLKKPQP